MFRRFSNKRSPVVENSPVPSVATQQQREQKLANEKATVAAAKAQRAETEFRNAQLREGVAVDKLKPLSSLGNPSSGGQYGKIEPGDKLNVAPPVRTPPAGAKPLPTMVSNNGGSGGNMEAGGLGGGFKKGGKVSGSGKSSSASSASKRGDGIAKKGKTKGRMI